MGVAGRVRGPEVGVGIEGLWGPSDAHGSEYNPQQLLGAEMLPKRLVVRNWRPGDRFWPAHTKEPKKIKELLQERHVPPPGHTLWPVALSGKEIVCLSAFPAPPHFLPTPPDKD